MSSEQSNIFKYYHAGSLLKSSSPHSHTQT